MTLGSLAVDEAIFPIVSVGFVGGALEVVASGRPGRPVRVANQQWSLFGCDGQFVSSGVFPDETVLPFIVDPLSEVITLTVRSSVVHESMG
jgi:hypothetical protein